MVLWVQWSILWRSRAKEGSLRLRLGAVQLSLPILGQSLSLRPNAQALFVSSCVAASPCPGVLNILRRPYDLTVDQLREPQEVGPDWLAHLATGLTLVILDEWPSLG